MNRASRRKTVMATVLIVAAILAVLMTRGPEAPTPNPPGSFSFAVLGDAPYYAWEEWQYRIVLQELDANDLIAVVHVGDIFWRPCSDEMYLMNLDGFEGLRHPVVYTPGDNEWADCWQRVTGEYRPLERLNRIREIFFAEPETSLGGRPMPLESQGSGKALVEHAEFVENVLWTHQKVVFATVHLIGSRNAMEPFPGRTEENDAESRRRTAAATAWIQATFTRARETGALAVVLMFHVNPGFEEPTDDSYRATYEPFIQTLEEEVAAFPGPVLIAHGDDHDYLVDHPLVDRRTGRVLANLTRMQVPGSPLVGWVRVYVDLDSEEPFSFRARVIPRWKYW